MNTPDYAAHAAASAAYNAFRNSGYADESLHQAYEQALITIGYPECGIGNCRESRPFAGLWQPSES